MDRKKRTFNYKYGIIKTGDLPKLKEDMKMLVEKGLISDNETFRSYLEGREYAPPEDFSEAKSLIVVGLHSRMMHVNIAYQGHIFKEIIPPGYYSTGLKLEDLENAIREDVFSGDDYKLVRTAKVPVKLAAVRSGLGRYGRNNLCYVDGFGSFATLFAFFTDKEFPEVELQPLKMLEHCKNCNICRQVCPTSCIDKENFVIDAGRCLSLYTEVGGEIPDWVKPEYHNALIGCMECQVNCPANSGAWHRSGAMEDITEEETEKILKGDPDDELLKTLGGKMKQFYPACIKEYFPVFQRNLSELLKGRMAKL